jgi:hypothetical protein
MSPLPSKSSCFRPFVAGSALLAFFLFTATTRAVDKPWPPPSGVPMTQWGKEVSSDKPVLPEYPRTQLVRKQWLNLNGMWNYAITPKEAAAPDKYDGKILVPFPVESVLSQVNKKVLPMERLWYSRTFEVPAGWNGKRILLNFGAVDWDANITVNGKAIGEHKGGYDAFSFDITDALTPSGPQELVVSVWDPVNGGEPHGKQDLHPGYISYTASIGIWQTVWLEPVAAEHIESMRMVSDIDHSRMNLTVATASPAAQGQMVDAVVTDAGKVVAHASGTPGQVITLPLPHAKLWWPESPFLYDLKVTLRQDGKPLDVVTSYFGMRKISVGQDAKGITRMLLNNQFVFENGLLDQGFWPDGIYTAPTDEALRYDLETTRKLGYNMLRKHVKVEPDRWYYWADKLGVLVWQDMPSVNEMSYDDYFTVHVKNGDFIPNPYENFENELRQMVRGRINHPSIVMWILFNEGWGMPLAPHVDKQPDRPRSDAKALQQRMVDAVRQEDPTRLIDPESGAGGGGKSPDGSGHDETLWDFKLGDVLDYHAYAGGIPQAEKTRAAVFGEYGWAKFPGSPFHFLSESNTLTISGMVNTQLTDVENETNGALNYDRTTKADVPLEKNGTDLIEKTHEAGYLNYPGHDPSAP